MTDKNLDTKIVELKELKAMKAEVEAEIKKLETELKNEMTARNASTLQIGIHKLTFKEVISNRFDSKALRAYSLDMYNKFVTTSASMRFTVN